MGSPELPGTLSPLVLTVFERISESQHILSSLALCWVTGLQDSWAPGVYKNTHSVSHAGADGIPMGPMSLAWAAAGAHGPKGSNGTRSDGTRILGAPRMGRDAHPSTPPPLQKTTCSSTPQGMGAYFPLFLGPWGGPWGGLGPPYFPYLGLLRCGEHLRCSLHWSTIPA